MTPTNKIEFVEGKESNGILVDWPEVWRRMKRLKIPYDVGIYNPSVIPYKNIVWAVLMSQRSVGKTTSLLLVGLILYQMYGIQTQYIRRTEDELKPKYSDELFNVLLTYENGRYISECSDGLYNTIVIKWRRAYLARADENGKIVDTDTDPWLSQLSIDKNKLYKSGYNVPKGDWIIVDEFIGAGYQQDEFVHLCDLLSTIRRQRLTPKVNLLANMINITSPYFTEMEIKPALRSMRVGEYTVTKTGKGTPIYLELIGIKQTAARQRGNRLFFGFKNPQLASITGEGMTWAFRCVPHIMRLEEGEKVLDRTVKLDCDGQYIQLDLVKKKTRYIIHAHRCTTEPHGDSLVLTNGDITEPWQEYGFGQSAIMKIYWKMRDANLWYYDSNETGALVDNYYKTALNN